MESVKVRMSSSGSKPQAKKQDTMAELSKNVQKLRFMQKATESADRKELEKRQLKAIERAKWVVPGLEEEAKDRNIQTDVQKAPAVPVPIMGRRSYGGFNPVVENFMRDIANKKAALQQQKEEREDLMTLHAMSGKRQRV